MSGLFTSFQTGVSGLRVSQAAMNTTAHNIANADTTGYVRQQTLITDSFYQSTVGPRNSLNQTGYGTDVASIRQVRDQFLDKQFRLETGRQSFYEAQCDTTMEVEDLFGEMEGEQFLYNMTDIWQKMQELTKTPDSISSRDLFISSASSFLAKCQVVQKQLDEYQVNLNSQIVADVNCINTIAEQIHELNGRIVGYEAGGESANDLRDQRNQLLDDLGQYINFSIAEDKNGSIAVYAEGAPLVTEDRSYSMKTEYVEAGSKMLKPVWADNGCGDVFFNNDLTYSSQDNNDVGSLRGIMTARGNRPTNYTDIPIAPKEADFRRADGTFDSTAYKVARNAYDAEVTTYNETIGPSIVMTVQAQFDQLVHGIVSMFNDVLCPNKEIELQDGSTIRVLDTDQAPIGLDEDGMMGTELFVRKTMPRYVQETVTLADGTLSSVYRYQEEDPANDYSLYSVREIDVNEVLLQNSAYLPIKSNPSTGKTNGFDQQVMDSLNTTWDSEFATLDPNTLTSYSFLDYYTAMIGSVATQGKVWNGIVSNEKSLVHSVDNNRQQIIGVSADEEMVELIKFQHAYNASSRYITVVDAMLEDLLQKLG